VKRSSFNTNPSTELHPSSPLASSRSPGVAPPGGITQTTWGLPGGERVVKKRSCEESADLFLLPAVRVGEQTPPEAFGASPRARQVLEKAQDVGFITNNY